ncbi:ChaN family lipoprotein [Lutimonas zeaxanthinifaciens]|uniref:ChaN family lipoprotein n=1 Tax=Lutimonas zeaxanthinifaciens TaxID=3060215 RepID=UPI00265CDBBF|nr:ChaN family lipoprotein [Lutimonas sp. YSD2104]WKK65674.1 ChaN family lipoprotein [Lutimonas sp. YSD2104]
MKLIKISLILLLFLVTSLYAQDKPAYKLYNNKGKEVRYDKMIKELEGRDMVFFGEYHTNPISHWLQLEVAQSLYEVRGKELLMGAEMFDNSLQLVLNEYLMGFYKDDKLIPEVTSKWGNYVTDYKPLVEFAKENGLRFAATNIPRRYASMIYKKGIESLQELSPEARAMIGPDLEKYFDPTVKAYAEMEEKMGEHVPPDMLNIQTSQASKDATMAHFSLKNFNPGDLLLHFQGSYHSNYDQGIIWWINKIQPGLDIMSLTTVTTSEWEEFSEEEINTIADFIIVVPDNMTQTSRRN